MVKVAFAVIIVNLICNFSYAQRRFFIGTSGDYSILMDQRATFKQGEREGGYVDYYVLREDKEFVFMLTISRVSIDTPFDSGVIYSEDFKNSISKECSCQILESDKVEFNNLKGVKFFFQTVQSDKLLGAISVNTVKEGVLFSINFIAENSKIKLMLEEYEIMLNSLVINTRGVNKKGQ